MRLMISSFAVTENGIKLLNIGTYGRVETTARSMRIEYNNIAFHLTSKGNFILIIQDLPPFLPESAGILFHGGLGSMPLVIAGYLCQDERQPGAPCLFAEDCME